MIQQASWGIRRGITLNLTCRNVGLEAATHSMSVRIPRATTKIDFEWSHGPVAQSGRARHHHDEVQGFKSSQGHKGMIVLNNHGSVAQSAERLCEKQEVVGSIPTRTTRDSLPQWPVPSDIH